MSTLFECVSVLAAFFVEEFGDEEDVVATGENCEGEDGRVNGREVVAGAVRDTRGEHDCRNSHDLDGCVDLPQHRGTKAPEPGHDVNCCRSDENENVAADHGHCDPKRYRQVRRHWLRENRPHR